MKKILKFPIVFLALFIFIPFLNIKAEEALEFKVDDIFNVPSIRLKGINYIMAYKSDDVNGDYIKDNIILVGRHDEGMYSGGREDIKLIIQDGKTKKYYKLSPGRFTRGSNGRLFLGDFNGDKVLDILISFNGRSTGYDWYSLISFNKNKPVHLFKQEEFNMGLSFDLDFGNGFKANIHNKELNKFYTVDVSNKKYTYTNLGIYDDNGELLKAKKGISDVVSEIRPVDIDKDGVYEVVVIQGLSGIATADVIAYAKSIWSFKNSDMKFVSLEIIPFATPGSLKKIQRIVPVGNFFN
jgi:hypothetical protein